MIRKLCFVALLFIFFEACNTTNIMPTTNSTTTYALRLLPGQDVKLGIAQFVQLHNIKAGWIATCVGSLTQYHIRFANQPTGTKQQGYFEIVSLTGTLADNGMHVHINVSDSAGHTIGGHLLDGNIVYTTAEIIIQSTEAYIFKREKDGSTPWEELQIKQVK